MSLCYCCPAWQIVLCKVERFVLTVLKEDYYYYYIVRLLVGCNRLLSLVISWIELASTAAGLQSQLVLTVEFQQQYSHRLQSRTWSENEREGEVGVRIYTTSESEIFLTLA